MINRIKFKYISLVLILLSVVIVRIDYTMAFLISKTDSITNVFEPYNYPTGSFTIKEAINHSLGEDYIIPNTIEFTYKIELGSYYKNQKITTSNGEIVTDENGTFIIKVKPENGIVINNIEEGTKVKVTNMTNLTGFTSTSEMVKEITVSKNENTNLNFTSSYVPNKVKLDNISLSSVVNIIGREWKENEEFTLKLEYFNNDVWEILDSKTIIYSNGVDFNKVSFTDSINTLEFMTVGTYKLRLSQEIGIIEDIHYDNTINNIEIVISDETMDGQLEVGNVTSDNDIVITKEENEYKIDVEFKNDYVIYEQEIEYVDNIEDSHLIEEIILVKNYDYNIDTVLSRFDGLDNNYTYSVFNRDGVKQDSNLVRTGDFIVINHNNKEYRFDIVLAGDVSGDGNISPLDYVKIKNHITKKNVLIDNVYLMAADVSGEGSISPLDYVKVKNHILKGGK